MNAGDFFAAVATLPIGTLKDVTRGGGLVVVAPHPDDESLGCGGLIASACALGVATRLLVLSDGAGSHPGSRRYPPQKLRALREAEMQTAAAALGIDARAIRFLRLPDRFVPTDGPDAEAARDAIVNAAHACGAGAVCVTWDRDPHCDHAAAAALVEGTRERLGVARIFAYPVWGMTVPPDADVGSPPQGLRIDISAHAEAKRTAIAAHRSQTTALIDDDPDGFRLSPEMIARFAGPYEILLETAPKESRS